MKGERKNKNKDCAVFDLGFQCRLVTEPRSSRGLRGYLPAQAAQANSVEATGQG